MLEVENLVIEFGGLRALDNVSFKSERGQILSIIGPNGAGKTTLFNVVSGLYRPKSGRVFLGGRNVTGMPAHQLAHLGLSRTFQNLQVFFQMTALENVMVGRHIHEKRGVISHLFGLPSINRQNTQSQIAALQLLDQLGLASYATIPAGSMPFGALKRLEIARALALQPNILLLDEPAAGCNPSETAELAETIRDIADTGVSVILVEHDIRLVMDISKEIVVLNYGRKLAQGSPMEIQANPNVIEAYLGVGAIREEANVAGA